MAGTVDRAPEHVNLSLEFILYLLSIIYYLLSGRKFYSGREDS